MTILRPLAWSALALLLFAPFASSGDETPTPPARPADLAQPGQGRPARNRPPPLLRPPSSANPPRPRPSISRPRRRRRASPPNSRRRRDKDKDAPKPAMTAEEAIAKANAYLDAARVMTADFVQIGPDGDALGRQALRRAARPDAVPIRPARAAGDRRRRALGRGARPEARHPGLYFIAQTPLKFLLADHIDIAKDTTVKRVAIDDNAATIEIEDKATFGGTAEIALVFDPDTFALKQWTVIDAQGFQTVVTLFNVDLTTQPDPRPLPHRRDAVPAGANRD